MKIFFLFTCLFSTYAFGSIGQGSGDEFVKSVVCAYNDGVDCQDKVLPLSEFKRCPEEEFGKQGAIAFGVTNWAVSSSKPSTIKKVIRYLLEIGCDIDRPNVNGQTALHSAVIMSSVEAVEFLIDHGADLSKKVAKSKYLSHRNHYLGLNTFDLVRKQHSKDLTVDGFAMGNTKIYQNIQQRFPHKLEVLSEKIIASTKQKKYIATEFGQVLLKASALDPDIFIYGVIESVNYPIGDDKTEAIHFEWFEKSEIAKKNCKRSYKISLRTITEQKNNTSILYAIDCS